VERREGKRGKDTGEERRGGEVFIESVCWKWPARGTGTVPIVSAHLFSSCAVNGGERRGGTVNEC